MDFLTLIVCMCAGAIFFVVNYFLVQSRKQSSQSQPPILPPRPEKGGQTASADYTNVYPPSRRHILRDIEPKLTNVDIDIAPPAEALLKLDEDYRQADPRKYNFTGFTVQEILNLGHFSNYAMLSGVPVPSPLVNFDIMKARARPYRPFRWAYHQTMSFKKMEPNYWLELDNTYTARIQQRRSLYAHHGKDVLQALPGSELACKELSEMIIQFLCARYPKYFELNGRVFSNRISHIKEDLDKIEPLHFIWKHVPEDFAITLRDPQTGRYCFRAGVICSSVGWKLGSKIGLGLPEVHAPVPDYKEKMELSMDRFFTRMSTDSPIQRGSWGLKIGQPLFLPTDHPDFNHRESQNPALTADNIHLRVDWQTLRRLPLSGAIIFNFKALFTPIREFREEPFIPSLVLKLLEDGKENLMKYKGTWHVEHVAKPLFRTWSDEQVTKGLIPEDWEPHTLDEYPFFPRWQEKQRH